MSHLTKRERQITWLARVLIVSATIVAVFYIFESKHDTLSSVKPLEFADATPSGLAVIPASGTTQSSYTGAYTGTYTGAYTSSYGGGISYTCNAQGTAATVYYPTCSTYPCGYDDPYHYYAYYYGWNYGTAYGGIQIRADRTDNGWAPACNNTYSDGYPGDTCITNTQVSGSWAINVTPSSNYTISYQTYTTYFGWRPTYSTSLFCAAPPPTCTLTATPNPINRGASATLTWSSTNATSFSINNIGAVATAGSTSVTPTATTNYGATVSGLGGTVSCPLTVTVNQPTATMTVNGGTSATVNVGQQTTWNWSSTYGSSYVTYVTLNQADACGTPVGPFAWTQGATASGSYSSTWQSCTAGRTYTYNYRVTNSAGYQIYASPVTVTVNPLPACTISLNPTSILRGSNSALNWSTSNAVSGSISPTLGNVGTASQQFSVSPTNTTTYTGSVTSSSGSTAQCTATLTVTCAPLYSCSGQTITYLNSSCNTSNVTTCTSPSYCVAGQSTCVNPPPSFNAGTSSGGTPLTGDLEANPQLVRKGTSARLYWNVSNVASCTVTGTNGNTLNAGCSGNTCTSGAGGTATVAINNSATYSLRCNALSGVSPSSFNHTVTVLPSPEYEEQ